MDTATTVDTSYWLITFNCIKLSEKLVLRDWLRLRDRGVVNVFIAGELPLDVNHLKEIGLLVTVDTRQKAETLGEVLPIPQVVEAWLCLLETQPKGSEIFLIADRRLGISLTAAAMMKAGYSIEDTATVLTSIIGGEFNDIHLQVVESLAFELVDRQPPSRRVCCAIF
jgi:hypothetical protein